MADDRIHVRSMYLEFTPSNGVKYQEQVEVWDGQLYAISLEERLQREYEKDKKLGRTHFRIITKEEYYAAKRKKRSA